MSEIDLSLDAQVGRAILPLIAVTSDATWHPVGTALVIARCTPTTALLLTATHNLEHWVRLDAGPAPYAANIPRDFVPPPPKSIQIKSTRFYAGLEGLREFVLAEVVKSWCHKKTDIAVVLAVIPDGRPAEFTASFALDFSPVAKGTTLMAIGCAGMAADFTSSPDYERQDFRVGFKKSVEMRTGAVMEIHDNGVGIYRWPGFIVGCRFDSGMSGGPLVDVSREVPIVRGIICGDVSEDERDGRSGSGAHPFGSVLWPALATRLDFLVQLENTSAEVRVDRLIDLVRHKVLDDRGDSLTHFRCVENGSGYTVDWI